MLIATHNRVRALLLPAVVLLLTPSLSPADAIPVELRKTEQGWQLLRGGEPYFIKGAGGNERLAELAAAGANSIRTWAADDIGDRLDEAHALDAKRDLPPVLRAAGQVAIAARDVPAARRHLAKAERAAADLGLRRELAWTLLLRAEAESSGKRGQPRPHVDRATALAQEIGDRVLSTRLRQSPVSKRKSRRA